MSIFVLTLSNEHTHTHTNIIILLMGRMILIGVCCYRYYVLHYSYLFKQIHDFRNRFSDNQRILSAENSKYQPIFLTV